MTTGLINFSAQKSKLHIIKLKKPTETNIRINKNYLKLFNKIKCKTKKKYCKMILEEHKHNAKQIWKLLKHAIGKENFSGNVQY